MGTQEMMMKAVPCALRAFVLCVAAGGAALAAGVGQAADPSGVWMVSDQTAKIRIEPCADGYWGVIDWERNPGTDANNPDPAKRARPLLGTPILLQMKPAERNEWQGKVYNPKDGGYYNATISLEGQDALKIEGCMLIFCGDEHWRRTSDPTHATTGASTQTKPRSVCPPQSAGAAPNSRN
jgi:uncharacterized protein (DUF2147 family)